MPEATDRWKYIRRTGITFTREAELYECPAEPLVCYTDIEKVEPVIVVLFCFDYRVLKQ